MDYKKLYKSICKRGQKRVLVNTYTEKHHIIMKSMGGTDSPSNITTLTAREHFIAHWLLSRIYPNEYKVQAAFKMMCDVKYENRYTPSSRIIAEARENSSKLLSIRMTGKKRPPEAVQKMAQTNRGRKVKEETKVKIRKALVGRKRLEFQDRIHINNGIEGKMVPNIDLNYYLEQGWERGRLPQSLTTREKRKKLNTGKRWINNGEINKFIPPDKLPYYINKGYTLGRFIPN